MSESSDPHLLTADPLGTDPMPPVFGSIRNVAGIIGVVGIALLLLAAIMPAERHAVFRGLLFGYWFWLSVSLGCFGFLMIGHLTGGGWGVVSRRICESAALNIPAMVLLSIILALGYKYLFPWANIELYSGEADEKIHNVLLHRHPFYNSTAFFIRQLIYFAIWTVWLLRLRAGQAVVDLADNPGLRRRLRAWAASGMILFFVTTTGLAFDYIMSRETVFFSSILGFIVAIGMGLSGMSFVVLNVGYFSRLRPLKSVVTPQHLNDLGNICLALVILWMYTSFAQFLIIWNGNMAGDMPYYVHRGLGYHSNGWLFVALWLFLGHFLLPFFLLLMKGLKRKVRTFCWIAGWIILMRFVENQWLIAPTDPYLHPAANSAPDPGRIMWTDLAAFLGVGGIWIFFYVRNLGSKSLLVRNAFHQPEVISHGSHAQHAAAH